ncbi:MAG: multiheme c-type cytochrome [Myxococcales bacterium]|nr:hypothetical protein [Myxococcota bacterium]MDW8282261.1 multiheme c-type cytochrome [Myxococcales bacterium]
MMGQGRRRGRAALLAVAGMALASALTCSREATGPARDAQARAQYRARHRPYDGAPPVIPHPVDALGRRDCLGCHRDGLQLPDGALAPVTPHPERTNCLQCHIEIDTRLPLYTFNAFRGLRHPPRGTRMHAAAPPALPHPLQERTRCLTCHGLRGGSPLRTPHPERTNCLQCHVPQLDGDIFSAGSEPR